MIEGLFDISMLAPLVKRYLPMVKEKFLPKINDDMAAALFHEDESLQDGESESVFMINRETSGDVMVRVCHLNDKAQVVRSGPARKLTDYLSAVLEENLTKI